MLFVPALNSFSQHKTRTRSPELRAGSLLDLHPVQLPSSTSGWGLSWTGRTVPTATLTSARLESQQLPRCLWGQARTCAAAGPQAPSAQRASRFQPLGRASSSTEPVVGAHSEAPRAAPVSQGASLPNAGSQAPAAGRPCELPGRAVGDDDCPAPDVGPLPRPSRCQSHAQPRLLAGPRPMVTPGAPVPGSPQLTSLLAAWGRAARGARRTPYVLRVW